MFQVFIHEFSHTLDTKLAAAAEPLFIQKEQNTSVFSDSLSIIPCSIVILFSSNYILVAIT